MSFNEHQVAYMRGLEKMPSETKCWCGWYPIGECHSCPPNKTQADRIKVQCPECGNYPHFNGIRPITHRLGCSHEPIPESARKSSAEATGRV